MNRSDLVAFYAPRLESMSDPALVMDQGGNVLYANRTLREMGNTPSGALAPGDLTEELRSLVRDWELQKPEDDRPPVREFRLRVVLPDGAGTRHVNWKCAAVPAADGIAALAWGTFKSTGPGREMGFTVLSSGIIQAASPALCTVCGYSRDELVGRLARHFYYTAASRRRIVNQLNERSEVENGVVTLRRKDGSPLTLWYSAEAIRDGSGQIQAYSGFFQQRPFPSCPSWRGILLIVDALPDLAWVSSRDLRIVAANQAYLQAYGRTREEVIGRTEYDFLSRGRPASPSRRPSRSSTRSRSFFTRRSLISRTRRSGIASSAGPSSTTTGRKSSVCWALPRTSPPRSCRKTHSWSSCEPAPRMWSWSPMTRAGSCGAPRKP